MTKNDAQITFAMVSDLQYAPVQSAKNRYFANSARKLDDVVSAVNERKPDFLINLGDTIDRDFENFDEILSHFRRVNVHVYHVLGNHDYEVDNAYKSSVPAKLGTSRYYHFSMGKWRFIVLDGNEISTFANLPDSSNYNEALNLLTKLETEQRLNAHFWNGGIGHVQLQWLEDVLCQASENDERAILFCHYPVFPDNKHNLLNSPELLKMISKYPCVKAWFCGHNHHGNYGLQSDIHHINIKGMVEGESDTAWCFVSLSNTELRLDGFGTEISARLQINN